MKYYFLLTMREFFKPKYQWEQDDGMLTSLDPYSMDPRFETNFRPVIKCEQIISQLSVIPGKKAKGITRCCHVKRKDQGRTARLVYLFSGPFVLST